MVAAEGSEDDDFGGGCGCGRQHNREDGKGVIMATGRWSNDTEGGNMKDGGGGGGGGGGRCR